MVSVTLNVRLQIQTKKFEFCQIDILLPYTPVGIVNSIEIFRAVFSRTQWKIIVQYEIFSDTQCTSGVHHDRTVSTSAQTRYRAFVACSLAGTAPMRSAVWHASTCPLSTKSSKTIPTSPSYGGRCLPHYYIIISSMAYFTNSILFGSDT